MRQTGTVRRNRGFLSMGFWSSYVKAFTPLESDGVCQAASVGRTVAVGSTDVMLDD